MKKQELLFANLCKVVVVKLFLLKTFTKNSISSLKQKELFALGIKFKLDLQELEKLSGLLTTMELYLIL